MKKNLNQKNPDMQFFDKHISKMLLLMLRDNNGLVLWTDSVVRKDNCWVYVSQHSRKEHLIKAACLSQTWSVW